MKGTPTLAEVVRLHHRSERLELHTAMAARIESYSQTTHRATVIPQVKAQIGSDDDGNDFETRPPIPNVPVAWPGGGSTDGGSGPADGGHGQNGFYIAFPLVKGNEGLLVFSEEAWGHFMESGQISEPGDLTRHDISYCAFLPCQISNTGAFEESDAGLIILPSESSLEIRGAGHTADWVVTVDRLKQAFSDAITQALIAVTPGDGGAGALTALKTQIEAMGVDDLGSNELKAGFQ